MCVYHIVLLRFFGFCFTTDFFKLTYISEVLAIREINNSTQIKPSMKHNAAKT